MAESTLSIAWRELQARVGVFLGWGRGSAVYSDTAWTNTQQFELDGIVASGLRQFYFPPPMEGETSSYDWSFLKPVASLALASGASTIPLPDDFGGFEGPLTIVGSSTASQPWPVEWRSEGMIRAMYSQAPSTTGIPRYAAQMPIKGTGPTQGQRFKLYIYPLADQAYTLQAQYYINPDYLSVPFPYAYGGAPHAETILESCLSVAEQRLDDSMTVHAVKFKERLAASISMDRRLKPQHFGYNGDRSDLRWLGGSRHGEYAPLCTYNGSSFG